MASVPAPLAVVVGTGLIGGSVALALKAQGYVVFGVDHDGERLADAKARGFIDGIGDDPSAILVVVAVPASSVRQATEAILALPDRNPEVLVTDVCGVKAPIVEAIGDPRFIGGHPMAGSEQLGLRGARADLFVGATWVLCPTAGTDPSRYARLAQILGAMGAMVVGLDAGDHDRLVAVVSHVPHLLASTLMHRAVVGAESDGALLQLAAGGFRDMTRVAAGDPVIWPEVLVGNAAAVTATLDQVVEDLVGLRSMVADGDAGALRRFLATTSVARQALPARQSVPVELAIVRVVVPDRPGVLAEVTRVASDLGVNVVDLQIAHSVEGSAGVLLLTVGAALSSTLVEALTALGYALSVEHLGGAR